MRAATVALLLLVLIVCAAEAKKPDAKKPKGKKASGVCAVGDLPCACAHAGGKWRALKKPLESTCTVVFQHQGRDRTFNIFFPKSYNENNKYPVWIHMHGVYWSSMGGISQQMGYTVPASDATPVWDTLATGQYRDKAIIVYPQATSPDNDLYRRTFWSLPFWHCSVGDCIDSKIDDIGYIEKIFDMLPKRVSMNHKKVYLTGTSAGGMMLQNLLCNSALVVSKVTAVADMIGGIGRPMENKCKPHGDKHVPFRIIHGDSDQVLRFDTPTDVDGAPFLSTRENAAMWKKLYNCKDQIDRRAWADDTTQCTTMCGHKDRRLDLCVMRGVGHDLNKPYQGYPFSVAWDFLQAF